MLANFAFCVKIEQNKGKKVFPMFINIMIVILSRNYVAFCE